MENCTCQQPTEDQEFEVLRVCLGQLRSVTPAAAVRILDYLSDKFGEEWIDPDLDESGFLPPRE